MNFPEMNFPKINFPSDLLEKGKGRNMCKLVDFSTNFGTVCKVADNKISYIRNILKNAYLCPDIEKIILFGSALEERCNDLSDIDIAIFGNKSENCFLKSKEFEKFEKGVYCFGEFQDYDILYFQNDRCSETGIMADINAGELIYQKRERASC
jgi:predicted nucleotidyltransferase